MQVIAIIADALGIHLPIPFNEGMANVLLQIRLPRVCLGVLIGAGLATAGASLQGLFRNPLADARLIGVSSGASLFAVLVIAVLPAIPALANHTISKHYLLNAATFTGACSASILVFRISRSGSKTLTTTMLLAGMGISTLCEAFIGLIISTANNEELRNITFWTLGSLGGANWNVVLSLTPFILLPLILLPRTSKSLNAYSLGEAEAMHMGINVRRLKNTVLILSTLSVGACVSVAGIIGFVGLIVPHILRGISGSDHRSLLPNSALLGATLLTLADTLSRTVIAPAEMPIGIITALLGTPLFIALLLKQKKVIKNWAS
ncbi:hemin ABC transporter, permease protein [Filimonas lacunae]|nr:hemin ABC transporter, permease protein [Filimonas lacunae]